MSGITREAAPLLAIFAAAMFCGEVRSLNEVDVKSRPVVQMPRETVSLPDSVDLEPGEYGGHLQDVCRDGKFLYWTHTRTILKTGFDGRIVARAEDSDHNAGCRVKDGRLYVAVCKRGGRIPLADREEYQLQINIYDAGDLHLIEKKVIAGAFDRAGSLEILPDGSFVIGCLRPPEVASDQVRFYHLSEDFKVLSRHEIDRMPVRFGIENIKYYGGRLYCFIYDGDTVVLDGKSFVEKGRHSETGGQLGAVLEKDGVWVGRCEAREDTPSIYRSSLIRAADFRP